MGFTIGSATEKVNELNIEVFKLSDAEVAKRIHNRCAGEVLSDKYSHYAEFGKVGYHSRLLLLLEDT